MSALERITTLVDVAVDYAIERLRSPRGKRVEEIATPAPWSDRDVRILGNGATPEAITSAITRRNEGYLRDWADLADSARRTFPTIHSELSTREQALQETEFDVLPGEGSNGRAARRAADACRDLMAAWQARDEGAGDGSSWERWCAEFVAAAFYPLAAHDVLWRRDAGRMVPLALDRIAERRLSYACDRFDPNPWQPRIWDDGDPTSPFFKLYGVPLSAFHRDRLLVHRRRVVGGHLASEGLFAVLVWFWLFNTTSWRDLMRLQEMLGCPPVIGYFSAGGAKEDGNKTKLNGERYATSTEVAKGAAVVQAMTGALRAMLPDTIRLETLKYELPAGTPIQLITTERLEKAVARVINGTDGVSSIVPGSRASQQVAFEQAMTPYRADARYAARMASVLFARFVRANPDRFGAACPLPLCVARTDPPETPGAIAALLAQAKTLGLKIPEAWAHEKLQIPVGKATEPTLGDGAQSPPVGATEKASTPVETSRAIRPGGEFARDAHQGVIVCLVPPRDLARAMAVPGGEAPQDLHITLAHLGGADALDAIDRRDLRAAVAMFSATAHAVRGEFSGTGRFSGDGMDALYASLDAPELGAFRESLFLYLAAQRLPVSTEHGFTPHMTLAYLAPDAAAPVERLDPTPVVLRQVAIWWAGEREVFDLN